MRIWIPLIALGLAVGSWFYAHPPVEGTAERYMSSKETMLWDDFMPFRNVILLLAIGASALAITTVFRWVRVGIVSWGFAVACGIVVILIPTYPNPDELPGALLISIACVVGQIALLFVYATRVKKRPEQGAGDQAPAAVD